MNLTSFYPVLCTTTVSETRDFYVQHFGFTVVFDAGWYVSLKRDGDPAYELAVLYAGHETIPEPCRQATAGVLLNFEVDDVDAEHRRLIDQAGLQQLVPLRDEPFGQRHFILVDPAGALVDVITPIPFAPEFEAADAT